MIVTIELQMAIALITIILSLGGSWGVMKYRLDRNEKEYDKDDLEHAKIHDTMFNLIRENKKLIVEHEKDSAGIRLDFEKRFGGHDTSISINMSQYAEILKRLDGIDKKIDRLEEDRNQ